jgi:DNA-binding transcriptional LysR family regulator
LIENSAAREGARLDVRLELESPETLRQLLLSGRIYGLLPYSSIFQDAQTRRLVPRHSDYDSFGVTG